MKRSCADVLRSPHHGVPCSCTPLGLFLSATQVLGFTVLLYRGQGKGALSREGAAWELASGAEGEARTGLSPALQAAASPAGGRLKDRCETKPQEWCLPGSRRLCRRRWLLQTPVEEEEDLKAFFFLLWIWSAL